MYSVKLIDKDLEHTFTNVIGDAFLPEPNNSIRYLIFEDGQRLEYSVNNYIAVFSKERNELIKKQQQKNEEQ